MLMPLVQRLHFRDHMLRTTGLYNKDKLCCVETWKQFNPKTFILPNSFNLLHTVLPGLLIWQKHFRLSHPSLDYLPRKWPKVNKPCVPEKFYILHRWFMDNSQTLILTMHFSSNLPTSPYTESVYVLKLKLHTLHLDSNIKNNLNH